MNMSAPIASQASILTQHVPHWIKEGRCTRVVKVVFHLKLLNFPTD